MGKPYLPKVCHSGSKWPLGGNVSRIARVVIHLGEEEQRVWDKIQSDFINASIWMQKHKNAHWQKSTFPIILITYNPQHYIRRRGEHRHWTLPVSTSKAYDATDLFEIYDWKKAANLVTNLTLYTWFWMRFPISIFTCTSFLQHFVEWLQSHEVAEMRETNGEN